MKVTIYIVNVLPGESEWQFMLGKRMIFSAYNRTIAVQVKKMLTLLGHTLEEKPWVEP